MALQVGSRLDDTAGEAEVRSTMTSHRQGEGVSTDRWVNIFGHSDFTGRGKHVIPPNATPPKSG